MQWTLVPPKPKLEMAARPPFQGVASATTYTAIEASCEHALLLLSTNFLYLELQECQYPAGTWYKLALVTSAQ